jgi:Uma2 family endonuclease
MMTVKSTRILEQVEPTWEIAHLFPAQGRWSEEDYLALNTNHLVEFSHGTIEVLPMPSIPHQRIVRALFKLLEQFVLEFALGEVLFSPVRVQLWPGKYREPDVVFITNSDDSRYQEQFWIGADLVMEVVSPDDRNRDLVDKRREYARARIPEYWIVDPSLQTIIVLYLEDEAYAVHGEFSISEQATSRLLPGFVVDVSTVFAVQE